jgi:Mrp family chromosome partitioning ATPase
LAGIDGATMDVHADYVVVRTPRVAGDLEFTPGSY